MDFNNLISLLPEFYQAIGETLVMVGISAAFGIVAGGAMGIWLYTSADRQIFANRFVHRTLGTLVSFMRSFPFVILMIVVMPLARALVGTSFGPVAASVSLSIAASFAFARLVEQNLKEVPRGIVEAAQAMGASYYEIVRYFLLPEAKGSLILSVTTGTIGLLGATAMAGAIGAGGVGDLALTYGYERMNFPLMLFTVVVLIVFVQIIQSVGNYFAARARGH